VRVAIFSLACGIPPASAPWRDDDGLFREGIDFLMAHDGRETTETLRDVLHDARLASSLAEEGRKRFSLVTRARTASTSSWRSTAN
jgi:spore maturation protein CgeB